MKLVWLLCHDSYIDHRILFFRDFFKEKGFSTKIFAGAILYNGFFGFDDHDIERPESAQTFYYYKNNRLEKNPQFAHKRQRILNLFVRLYLRDLQKTAYRIAKSKKIDLDSYCLVAKNPHRFILRRKLNMENTAIEFDSQKNQIDILTTEEATRPSFKDPLHEKAWDETVDSYFIDNIYNLYPQLRHVLKKVESPDFKKPDYIYVADLLLLPMGAWLKKILGVKLIIDCHEWWAEQHKVWVKEDLLARKIDEYERKYYAQCDLRFTVGETLAQDMQRHFEQSFGCVRTVGGSTQSINDDSQQFWKKYIPDYNNQKIFLFQGSLTTHRNLDNLARLTRFMNQDELLVVVGDGPYLSEFMKIIKREGDIQRLRFLGWQNQETLFTMTHHGGVGIVPYFAKNRYLSTAAPNKFFEYIAAGIPIVCDHSMLELSALVNKFSVGRAVNFNHFEETLLALREMSQKRNTPEFKTNSQKAKIDLGEAEQKKHFAELLSLI